MRIFIKFIKSKVITTLLLMFYLASMLPNIQAVQVDSTSELYNIIEQLKKFDSEVQVNQPDFSKTYAKSVRILRTLAGIKPLIISKQEQNGSTKYILVEFTPRTAHLMSGGYNLPNPAIGTRFIPPFPKTNYISPTLQPAPPPPNIC